MSKSRILVQLDTDPQASVFDAVVAIDAGAERLLQYANIKPEQVRDLIHGAMYTRGPADLKNTAIFVGGSNVAHGEQVFRNAVDTMFEPFKVSVMIDCNGSNHPLGPKHGGCRRHQRLEAPRARGKHCLGASSHRPGRATGSQNPSEREMHGVPLVAIARTLRGMRRSTRRPRCPAESTHRDLQRRPNLDR